jgi:uncharacterized protein (DUF2252 family)
MEQQRSMIPPQGDVDQDYFSILADFQRLPMLQSFVGRRPSRAERLEIGRKLRREVPRTAHAAWRPPRDRADPIAVLEEQNAARAPKLVALRNARMLASPFGFLRGAAAIMAADLATAPSPGLLVAACGDMHVANFGMFASAERNLVFAINDFDEVHPGPWEWDLKRLAASAAVAAAFGGGDRADAEEAARAAVASYRERMRGYAEMPFLEIWYDQIDAAEILAAVPARLRRQAKEIFAKARAKGHQRTLDKLTEEVDGERRIVEDVPLVVRETRRDDGTPIDVALDAMLRGYFDSLPDDRKRLMSRYHIVDVARKVGGVGSVGTNCWIIYLEGTEESDPLFLQVKEALPSVLAPHVAIPRPIANQGKRVVVGQRLTQGAPDIFLGWGTHGPDHFYVRQLADMKGGVRFGEGEKERLDGLPDYCRLCGWALALAHAKSGDPAMIAGYIGKSDALDEAIARFSLAYLAQTERDHAALEAAERGGRLQTDAG